MAETPTFQELIDAVMASAKARTESGVRQMAIGDRSFTYDSTAELIQSIRQLRALEAEADPTSRFTLARLR